MRGFSFSGTEVGEKGSFWASPLCLVHLGGASFACHPTCVYKVWVSKMCRLLDTPCGRRLVGALSLLPRGVCWAAQKTANQMCYGFCFYHFKLYMLALVGRPSLHSYDACMVFQVQGASRRNCRQKHGKTSYSPKKVFLFSRNPETRFWGLVFWFLWMGRIKNPVPGSAHHLAVEVFNVAYSW